MEKIEEIGFGGLKLVQREDGFKFGVDAVILADFADSLFPQALEIADLGTGNGIIPMVLSHKNKKCHMTGIDIQEEAIELADKSCRLNGLEERIDFIRMDIAQMQDLRPDLQGRYDAVVTNPPYVGQGSGIVNRRSAQYIARQETTADLECFIRTAAWMFRDRGHFFMVHRPARLVDILFYCRKHGLEPKDMRLVTPRRGEIPNLVMVHCVLRGGRELKVYEELAIRNADGSYTAGINAVYERENSLCL